MWIRQTEDANPSREFGWRSGADGAGSYDSGLLTDDHRRVWSALD
jgi:hypothetical protein